MREYFAVACKIPEGNFVVIFPDLPDCVAFADTLERAPRAASTAPGRLHRGSAAERRIDS
jgi:predicted RNase H-like HicB family nuclease